MRKSGRQSRSRDSGSGKSDKVHEDRGQGYIIGGASASLDYGQNALFNTTEAADSLVRRACNRSARAAAGLRRSKPSLKRAGWVSWDRRREAAREACAAKIVGEQEPQALWGLLPPKVKRDMTTKSQASGELETPAPKLPAGEKAFRIWAARVYNSSLHKSGIEVKEEDQK